MSLLSMLHTQYSISYILNRVCIIVVLCMQSPVCPTLQSPVCPTCCYHRGLDPFFGSGTSALGLADLANCCWHRVKGIGHFLFGKIHL